MWVKLNERLDDTEIFRQLDLDIARAEAVVKSASASRERWHHQGQLAALRKAKALLECRDIKPRETIQVQRDYTIRIPWSTIVITILCFAFLFSKMI